MRHYSSWIPDAADAASFRIDVRPVAIMTALARPQSMTPTRAETPLAGPPPADYISRKPQLELPMLDTTTPKGRIIDAALTLAAAKPWGEITLREIAEKAGVPLADLRRDFAGRAAILAAFTRAVDDAVMAKAPASAPGESRRDTLFEVVMARFDALAPYKPALKSIAGAGLADPALIRPFLASQNWMLATAGIGTDGWSGPLRVAGLGSVYASVFRTWLDDDDAGLARTMAALDRRLRRGESTLGSIESTCESAYRVVTAIPEAIGSIFSGRGGASRGTSSGDTKPL